MIKDSTYSFRRYNLFIDEKGNKPYYVIYRLIIMSEFWREEFGEIAKPEKANKKI